MFQVLRSVMLLLYLEDKGTSWLVLIGILKVQCSCNLCLLMSNLLFGFNDDQDLCYDGWKIFKILQPTFHFRKAWIPISFRLEHQHDNTSLTLAHRGKIANCSSRCVENASEYSPINYELTAEYDMLAVKHGWLCLSPLVVGLPIYYLKYYMYKSWYVFV